MEELISEQCYCLKQPCQGLLETGEGQKARCCIHRSKQAATSPAIHKPSHRTTWLFGSSWQSGRHSRWPDSCWRHLLDRQVVSTAWTITPLACSQIVGLSSLLIHHASIRNGRNSNYWKYAQKMGKMIPLSKTLTYLQGRGIRQRRPSLGCHPDLWGSPYSLKSQVSMGRHGRVSGPMMETARAPRMVLSGTAPWLLCFCSTQAGAGSTLFLK